MYVLPLTNQEGKQMVVFVLEKENVLRMLQGDPVTLSGAELATAASKVVENFDMEKAEIVIAIASPGEREISHLTSDKDVSAFMRVVFRGHKIMKGDGEPITSVIDSGAAA